MPAPNENETRKKFNILKKYYDETWDENEHTLHIGIFKKDSDQLSDAYRNSTNLLIQGANQLAQINDKSIVLDVCCGVGRTIIKICEQYNCRGVGIDLSDEQIKDAKVYLEKLNSERSSAGLPKVQVKFVRGSASDLDKYFKKDAYFTHIISQDGILLVEDKISLFKNISRLLAPIGVLAISDWTFEITPEQLSEHERNLLAKLVNWRNGFSNSKYQEIITNVGLKLVRTAERNDDMAKTYEKLVEKIIPYENQDKVYSDLKDRYLNVVSAVKDKKMGWTFFFAEKPPRPIALLAGTKEKSIGRYLASALHKMGWEVWLYSRSAKRVDRLFWHERKCDLSKERDIDKLFGNFSNLNLVMMLAESEAHGFLEELDEQKIKNFIDSKLTGSALLLKSILKKSLKEKIKVVWCGGKLTKKPKDLMLYSMINSGLAAFVGELNDHYKDRLEAYYLPTPIISPSTIGDDYIQKVRPDLQSVAIHPKFILDNLIKIIEDNIEPGLIEIKEKTI